MPQEITHWLIAEKAATRLEGTAFGEAAAIHPNCLHLGAVCHDLLYYLRPVRKNARMLHLADALHGTSTEDTFDIVRVMAAAAETGDREAWISLLLGAVAHICADVAFHPLIVYLTGDSYNPDPIECSAVRQAHRRCETLLDVHFLRQHPADAPHSLLRYIREAEIPAVHSLAHVYDRLLDPPGPGPHTRNLQRDVRTALRNFVCLQTLGRRTWLCAMICALEPILPRSLREITALLYAPQLERHLATLTGTISYRHPVTGKPVSHSFAHVFDEAVNRTIDMCQRLLPVVEGAGAMAFEQPGPCLALGLPNGMRGQTAHVRQPPLRFRRRPSPTTTA